MGNKEGKKGTSKKPQSAAPSVSHCGAQDCKQKESRFGFCSEHFDQYKFGLITKKGAKVPDYDKKFKHWEAFQAKQSARKAA